MNEKKYKVMKLVSTLGVSLITLLAMYVGIVGEFGVGADNHSCYLLGMVVGVLLSLMWVMIYLLYKVKF